MDRLSMVLAIIAGSVGVYLLVMLIIITYNLIESPQSNNNYNTFTTSDKYNSKYYIQDKSSNLKNILFKYSGTKLIENPDQEAKNIVNNVVVNNMDGIFLDISSYSDNVSNSDITSWGNLVYNIKNILPSKYILAVALSPTYILAGNIDLYDTLLPENSILNYIYKFNVVFVPHDNADYQIKISLLLQDTTSLGLIFNDNDANNYKIINSLRKQNDILFNRLNSMLY